MEQESMLFRSIFYLKNNKLSDFSLYCDFFKKIDKIFGKMFAKGKKSSVLCI